MDKEEMQAHLNAIESAQKEIEQAHTDMKASINTIDMEVDEIYQGLAEEEALAEEERERKI